jgi:hypothetical protein
LWCSPVAGKDRHAYLTCFTCNQVGHSAKDCLTISEGSTTTETNTETTADAGVGICYRCGSRKHDLTWCWQPVQPDNRLPFALRFMCSESDHLASSCKQNNGEGVYPNRGLCKLHEGDVWGRVSGHHGHNLFGELTCWAPSALHHGSISCTLFSDCTCTSSS